MDAAELIETVIDESNKQDDSAHIERFIVEVHRYPGRPSYAKIYSIGKGKLPKGKKKNKETVSKPTIKSEEVY